MVTRGFRSLRVYQVAYQLALDIHRKTKSFPREERYDLTDQLRRSSRAVPRNIAEAWRKRAYPNHFFQKLTDSSAEASETEVSLDMAKDFGYMTAEQHQQYLTQYDEIQRMFYGMMNNPERFQTSVKPPRDRK